ncbi:alcohol dehydrogenase-like protein [Chaetomium fimeti]|uniref:Alcohol dehydrogenase-like protein n=1 Tax=Chaetomium fimeti TaxID=1854472 RepID=A0AAE0HAJ4_9PEZI|nr:alcohol dehydrogenase-like protein [Chaetomium fimeti]
MKEALVSKGTQVQIVDSPIPTPNEDQVLIKVIASGSNPKDWKYPDIFDNNINQGDDIAGIVEKVGANVFEFKPGDRVAAFHEMRTAAGSFAEYAIAWQHTTFHIPASTTFEEAATIPLAAMTAAVALYLSLGLPQPWSPTAQKPTPTTPTPLIIYGAATAVGVYAIQLAQRSNIHPLLCVAGRACDYVSSLLDSSRGDAVIDYREGDEAVVAGLVGALQKQGLQAAHVLDAVSEGSSVANLVEVLKKAGRKGKDGKVLEGVKVTGLLGRKEGWPEGAEQRATLVADVHGEAKDFGYVYFRYFARGLQEGWFKGQRTEVVPGGLGGIQDGLRKLKEGKASGLKYVFRIGETEGVER